MLSFVDSTNESQLRMETLLACKMLDFLDIAPALRKLFVKDLASCLILSSVSSQSDVRNVIPDAENVQVLSVLAEPALGDATAVGDDGGVDAELLLAELDQVPEELGLEEGLPAGEVDLAHAPLLAQHAEAPARLALGEAVRGLGGVEAEAAGVVALPRDVVVDAEALGHGHQVLDPPWLGFSSLNHLIFQSYMYPML